MVVARKPGTVHNAAGMSHPASHLYEQAPRAALRPFVRRFLVVEFSAPHHDAHLPDTSPVAAFSFRGACRGDAGAVVPVSAFTGLRETLRAHQHAQGHAVLLARFTPVGAAAFLRPPQQDFAGMTTDLAGVLAPPAQLEALHEQLALAPDHAWRVRLLEDFLLARLRLPAPDPLVAAAAAWLERGGGRIEALARHLGLSQSALERRFRRVVGLTPKKFASLARLGRAVRLRAGGADLTAVAHGAGYFDQAHFIHDFRRVTGSAPEAYFRQAGA
jgi:AraC-like DNA-binding protein